ncbi:hypothetical protein M3661_24330 [Paenibacillus sp. MER 180]|uniref:hypothetical protein n=1 Tax=Paenibacillus sp. MER 180 TaxID=2939570 RepID=UPI00203D9811|nr:hypothetical protein [Paenibacillus sp. MER 180]MCM3293242.1 hypothetical protein [Paenibacillus sp. MER 180]
MQSITALSFAAPKNDEDMTPTLTTSLSPTSSSSLLAVYDLSLAHTEESLNDDAWSSHDGHRIELMKPDPQDRSQDRLFINEQEITPGNWRWCVDGVTLRWNQGSGNDYVAGELAFNQCQSRAVGSVMFNQIHYSAAANVRPAEYNCRLIHNDQVAYRADGQLKWVENELWNTESLWSNEVLRWSFWVEEYVDEYGTRGYRPRLRFQDIQTNEEWTPQVGSFSAQIDENYQYHYKYISTSPFSSENDDKELTIPRESKFSTLFPIEIHLKLQPDATAVKGVIEVKTERNETIIYGLKGVSAHPYEVLQLMHAEMALEEISAAVSPPKEAKITSTTAGQDLQPYYLYNLDPYEFIQIGEKTEKVVRDAVQHYAEASLIEIIQYYMPSEQRRKFISASPIDIDENIRTIAETKVVDPDDAAGQRLLDPKAFYRSLTTPLLSIILKGQTPKVNARRARKQFEEKLSSSAIYQQHAPMLYKYHFVEKFPAIKDYFDDERLNLEDKAKKIKFYTDAKKKEYTALRDQAETDDVRKQYDLLLEELDEMQQKALEGKFWAHRVFTHFTGDDFLNMLKMQLFASPDGAKATVRNIQRVSTVLSVLDDSQYFAKKFADTMRIFQLYNILAQNASLREDQKTLRDITEEIAKEFAKQHNDSTDALTKLVAEAIKKAEEDAAKGQKNLWTEIMSIIYVWFEQVGRAQSIAQVVAKLTAKLNPLLERITEKIIQNPALRAQIEKYGLVAKTVASKVLWLGIGGITISAMIFMMVLDWDNMDPATKTGMIMVGVGMLANFALSILKAGMDFYTVYRGTGSFRGALKWAVGLQSHTVEQMERMFADAANHVLQRLSGGRIQLAQWANLSGWKGSAAKFAIRCLQNLTRIAMIAISAIMAAINIVLSAISLAKARTPLESAVGALAISSSILELIGLGFELASVLTVGTASSVLGVIAGVFAGFAILVALAGVGIMIYLAIKAQISPVDEFVENEARQAHLDMPKETDIDYMLPIYDKSGKLLKEGVTISDSNGVYLITQTGGQAGAGSLTRDQTTCFGITTDGEGRAVIYSAAIQKDQSIEVHYLTASESRSLSFQNKRMIGEEAVQQLWHAELIGNAETTNPGKDKDEDKDKDDNKELQLVKGLFQLYTEKSGTRSYLGYNGTSFILYDNPQQPLWLRLESTKASSLSMNDVKLYTEDRDMQFYANLAFPGSESRKWALRGGDVPSFMTFDADQGVLVQKQGIAPEQGEFGPYQIALDSGSLETLESNEFYIFVANTPGDDIAEL